MSKENLITEILTRCKASNVPTTGDLFFGLIFRTETELKKICHELNIKTDKIGENK